MFKKWLFVAVVLCLLVVLASCSVSIPETTGHTTTTAHQHTPIEMYPQDATCTESGRSASSFCFVCGEILEPETTYPALGHEMGADGNCIRCKTSMIKVSLNVSTLQLHVGDEASLSVAINPTVQDMSFTWESSAPNVASVSSSGVVKAHAVGTAVIAVKTNGGQVAKCVVNVEKEPYSNTLLYEDQVVSIHYVSLEKDAYSDDVVLKLRVENKVNYDLLIQNDTVVINGYCFNETIMSDPVAARTTAYVETTISNFNYNAISLSDIRTVGGQFRIIDDTGSRNTYEAIFVNISLYGEGSIHQYPAAPGNLEQLYSDSKVNIYYSYAEIRYSYLYIYLLVENKTNETILIQNDHVVINGATYSRTIMSDPISAYSTGLVAVSLSEYGNLTPAKITTIGGKFRIISDQNNWRSYDAVIGQPPKEDTNEQYTLEDGSYVFSANGLTIPAVDPSSTYGYPKPNQLSSYSAVDILVITNVTGGFTIQDCYGRYMYSTSNYNSFNVSATMPSSGHIWKLEKVTGGYKLVNVDTGKTVSYNPNYSSWGVYAAPASNYYVVLTVTKANSQGGGGGSTEDSTLWTYAEVSALMRYHDNAKYYFELASEYSDKIDEYALVSWRVGCSNLAVQQLQEARKYFGEMLKVIQANRAVNLTNSSYATLEEMVQDAYDQLEWVEGLEITEDNYDSYYLKISNAVAHGLVDCLGIYNIVNQMLDAFN